MQIILSPSKEMAPQPKLSERKPILLEKALELSQPEYLSPDPECYQAIDLYNGLQFRYLREGLSEEDLAFLDDRLIILSAQYGLVRPFDGIRRYRKDFTTKGLYKAWADSIYQALAQAQKPILNLASQEFSKTISRYATEADQIINVDFFEQTADGPIKKHSTISKKGRGQMVNFIARHRIKQIEEVKKFNDMGYSYSPKQSDDSNWTFIRPRDL